MAQSRIAMANEKAAKYRQEIQQVGLPFHSFWRYGVMAILERSRRRREGEREKMGRRQRRNVRKEESRTSEAERRGSTCEDHDARKIISVARLGESVSQRSPVQSLSLRPHLRMMYDRMVYNVWRTTETLTSSDDLRPSTEAYPHRCRPRTSSGPSTLSHSSGVPSSTCQLPPHASSPVRPEPINR